MQEDGDDVLTCPNNPAHRVSMSRMQFHLAKCNHVATTVLAVCRFNAAHQMPALLRDSHERICADRKIVELGLLNKDTGAPPVIMNYVVPDLPESSESWEDDDAPSYDPSIKSLNAPVLRSLQGATKSERKHHRMAERERHQLINDGIFYPCMANPPGVPAGLKDPNAKPKQAYDYAKALRAPATKSKTFEIPAQGRGMGLGRGKEFKPVVGYHSDRLDRVLNPTKYSQEAGAMTQGAGAMTQGAGAMAQGAGAMAQGAGAMAQANGQFHDTSDEEDDNMGDSERVPEVEFPHLQEGDSKRK